MTKASMTRRQADKSGAFAPPLRAVQTGRGAYHSGLAAEDQVARLYDRSGRPICARRWRGSGGEIDLIARDGAEVIFIEVKKSRSHAEAAEHLTPRQMARIYASASEFLAGEPKGQNTDVRFDVALVNAMGQIEILENAFAA
jgi:putative endonuclease